MSPLLYRLSYTANSVGEVTNADFSSVIRGNEIRPGKCW